MIKIAALGLVMFAQAQKPPSSPIFGANEGDTFIAQNTAVTEMIFTGMNAQCANVGTFDKDKKACVFRFTFPASQHAVCAPPVTEDRGNQVITCTVSVTK